LEVIVPFKSADYTIDLDAKAELANSIKEAVGKTFSTMNKTVEVIKVYKMSELGNNTYEAVVDVELKNAVEFGVAPLVINTGRITLDESSKLLKTYISILKNFTLKSTNGFASKLNSIKIEFEKILISFDQKLDAALANHTNQTKPVNSSLFTSITIEQTNNNTNNKIDIIKNVLSFKTNNSVAGSSTQSTTRFDSTLKNIAEEITNKKFDQPTQTPTTTVIITSTSTIPTTVTSTTVTMSTTSVFMFHFKNISRPINTITFRRQTQTPSLPSTSKLVAAKLTSLNTYAIPTVKILPDSTSTSTSTSTETTTIITTSSSTTSTSSTSTTTTTTTTSTTTPTTSTETTPSTSTSSTSTHTSVSTTETTESTSTSDAPTTTPAPKTTTTTATTSEFLLTTTFEPSLKANTIPLFLEDSKQKTVSATEQIVSTPETTITLEIEKSNNFQTSSSSSLPSTTLGTSVPSSTTPEENLFKPKEKDDNLTEDMKTTDTSVVAEESLGLKVKNSDILSELRKLDKILSGGRKKTLVLKPNSIFLNKNLNEQEKKPKFGVLTDPIMDSLIETSTVKIVYPIIEDIDVPISTTIATITEKFIQSETTNAFDLTKTFSDLSKPSPEPLYFINLKTSTPIDSTSKIPEIVKETTTLSQDFFPKSDTNKETSTPVSTSTESTTESTTGTSTEISNESTKISTTLSIIDSTTESTTVSTTDSTTVSTTDSTTESTTGSTSDSTTETKTTLESLLFEIPSRENKSNLELFLQMSNTQDNLNNESTIKWKHPTESVPISILQTEKPISLSTTTISIITDLEINRNIESFINSNAFLNDKPSKPTNTNDLDIELQIDDESIIKKILNDSLDINNKNNNQNNNSNPSKST